MDRVVPVVEELAGSVPVRVSIDTYKPAVVGAVLIAGEQKTTFSTVLGTIAVAASVTNIVSGFLITDRMLRMFKKREPSK